MKKCPKCNEIFTDFAGVYPDTCPKCKIDLDSGLKISENTEDKKPKSGINIMKEILAFILDLIIAYFLGAIIIFVIGLILYQGLVFLGQLAPSIREGLLLFFKMNIFDFLLKIIFIILMFLYFKILPKLMGKTLGKKIFRI